VQALLGGIFKIQFMEQTSNAVTISSLPIIGIQHEVQDENGEVEVQVEYFALNPVKLSRKSG
jgi:hypothetical protein